jgi:hypothetical protein
MAIKTSVTARNAALTSFIAEIGASPILKIFNGTVPATTAAADANGTPLVTMTLPATAFGAVSAASVAKAGTWSGVGTAAAGAGTDATHFRIYDAGLECHYQGTLGETGTDMIIDNSNIATSQVVTVTTFTITQPDG